MSDLRWHKRRKMQDGLARKVRGAVRVTIDPKKFQAIYGLLKGEGIVHSHRDFARKCGGVSSTTIDDWMREPDRIDSKMSTVEEISRFCLPHLKRIWGMDADELAESLLGKTAPLRNELKQALQE